MSSAKARKAEGGHGGGGWIENLEEAGLGGVDGGGEEGAGPGVGGIGVAGEGKLDGGGAVCGGEDLEPPGDREDVLRRDGVLQAECAECHEAARRQSGLAGGDTRGTLLGHAPVERGETLGWRGSGKVAAVGEELGEHFVGKPALETAGGGLAGTHYQGEDAGLGEEVDGAFLGNSVSRPGVE